jgi:hypothetical protein
MLEVQSVVFEPNNKPKIPPVFILGGIVVLIYLLT